MSFETKIPTEILQEIFHHLCDEPIALHKPFHHSDGFPWVVGKICRRWRETFISHPHLWTSLSMGAGYYSASLLVRMKRRTAMCLERSRQLPLTIHVSESHSASEDFHMGIWEMLLSCSNRWKKADLVLGTGSALNALNKRRNKMPILESLKISICEMRKDYGVFQVAPRLTELDLELTYQAIQQWQFPWAQLTKLRIEMTCLALTDGLRQVLFLLQSVEELRFSTTDYFSAFQTQWPAVRLARLRLLEVTPFIPGLLSWFITPCLENIQVGCIGNHVDEEETYTRPISSLICRSSCQIRRLAIFYCGITESRMIMKALTSVEQLSIMDFPCIIQSILGFDLCTYLPKLRVLQVTCHQSIDPERDGEQLVAKTSRFLEACHEESRSALSRDTAPLEKLALWLNWDPHWVIPHNMLEVMSSWPSFVDVYVNNSLLERSALY
ncbi:hypothetical protein F5887DRAFT_1244740 [Amanita rubescens]|nr:hypothetical protein F5887DRAFT_1244740 [Amanita rubescens]